ncbi:hypothetical protein CPC08DRAFT_477908 [Agrocybe pediades]|nr:hypothetical protein CPC08DRAFT_477908 [Agrocybe pediades]
MPTQVQRQPSDALGSPSIPGASVPGAHAAYDNLASAKAQEQYRMSLQHKEALRLALGSILTPKRPAFTSNSRSSSGTASPAHPFGFPGSSASGTHTPVGYPPNTSSPYHVSPQGYGPNSSDHLHTTSHGHNHHPLQPSRLGRTSSNSSSPLDTSGTNSNQPSPRPRTHGHLANPTEEPHLSPAISAPLTPVPDMEPLPPAMVVTPPSPKSSSDAQAQVMTTNTDQKPIRPSIMPLHPSKEANSASMPSLKPVSRSSSTSSATGVTNDGHVVAASSDSENNVSTRPGGSGSSTPKSKFLQTLQSKSAWDALIHGSFS